MGAGGDVPAKWNVTFPSDFLSAWIEEEMGEQGGVGSEPGKGRFYGEHARAGMMMKRRREKFKWGFQVWPGKCFAGRGNFGGGVLGVICRQRE